jgi:hypothetical protein
MLQISHATRIFVCSQCVDFRKGIDGLAALCRAKLNSDQIEALLDRIANKCLEADDYPLLADLIRAIVWMNLSLQEKELTIRLWRRFMSIIEGTNLS